jgi:hypothetical protein
MLQKLKDLLTYMNETGINVPMARNKGQPSVSLTLLILSSIFVMLALLSFSIKILQINFLNALTWHIASAVLYYNRSAKISKDGIEISSNNVNNKQAE